MPKRRPPTPVTASLITKTVVNAAPTSTTNITGFLATNRGLSFTNDSRIARLIISGSKRGRARIPLDRSCVPSCLTSGLCSRGAVRVGILKHLSVQHLKMLNNRTQRKRREIRECADDDDGPDQQNHE